MLKERDAGERHQATDEQGNVTKGIGFWCTDVDEMASGTLVFLMTS